MLFKQCHHRHCRREEKPPPSDDSARRVVCLLFYLVTGGTFSWFGWGFFVVVLILKQPLSCRSCSTQAPPRFAHVTFLVRSSISYSSDTHSPHTAMLFW